MRFKYCSHCCFFQMNTKHMLFILGSLFISQAFGMFTVENVVFQKTNEIFINDAHWSVTFVHDLRPFQNLINKIKNDIEHTGHIMKAVTNLYKSRNYTGYVETFLSLHVETEMLTEAYKSIYDNFDEYQSLSVDSKKNKRSLLPIVGQLMSNLFGTVSEDDLENINRNIKALASNQKQIIHDLDVSLSVLNLTRMQVAENRRSIMDLVVVVQKLDAKIVELGQVFEQKFGRLEQFINTYLQFQLILDEIKLTIQNGVIYLENLKSELSMLSMHHLSTNTISPKNLKELLLDVDSKLPNNFELPRNPRKDIWYFYKTLTCITYLEDNEIRIILQIPLINTKEEYELYKVHNLPLPLHHMSTNMSQTDILVKYSLETDMLLVSEDRSKFSLLSENAFQMCSSYHFQFCNPETAFYQANMNKFCVMALFTQSLQDIKTFCRQMVVLDQKLPVTKYLSHGIWIVVTNKPLTFTINCQIDDIKISDVKIVPPFGIIQLNNTCKASNKYLRLPEYFGKRSVFERSDPLRALLKLRNISHFSIWSDSKTEFSKLKSINMPAHLTGLKEIPMQSFLRETRAYKTIDFDDENSGSYWTFVAIIIVVSVLIIIVIGWYIARKRKYHVSKIIGKRLANVHDLERVEVKQSPSSGEDIEMSALIENRNVNNDLEGQQNSFRRTDATLAWIQK